MRNLSLGRSTDSHKIGHILLSRHILTLKKIIAFFDLDFFNLLFSATKTNCINFFFFF